jgi:hypothetical protein
MNVRARLLKRDLAALVEGCSSTRKKWTRGLETAAQQRLYYCCSCKSIYAQHLETSKRYNWYTISSLHTYTRVLVRLNFIKLVPARRSLL